MKIKINKLAIILLTIAASVMLVFLVSRVMPGGHQKIDSSTHRHEEGAIYQCPMHPQIVQDHPGKCPICHMDLQKVAKEPSMPVAKGKGEKDKKPLYYRHPMNPSITSPAPAKDDMGMDFIPVYEQGGEAGIPGRSSINITPYKQQLIGVKLGEVKKQKLTKTIYTVGRIAFDPMLYQAQEEYLSALRAYKAAHESPVPGAEGRAKQLLEASRLKLRLSGLSDKQIESLAGDEGPDESLLITAEDGTVWMYADIYEQELPFVKVGQTVEASLPAEPGKVYEAEIQAIDPVLNMKTRTARIRAQLKTEDQTLRPGMYANAVIQADMGESLVVPRTAVLFTGKRNIVFAALGDGRFEPRDIRIGKRGEKMLEVLNGLREGEKIAVSGNFLIDAESQLFGSAGGGAFYSGQEAGGTQKQKPEASHPEGSHHD